MFVIIEKQEEHFYHARYGGPCSEYNELLLWVTMPSQHLGIGRKRKIAMLLTEKLNLPCFYHIDDDLKFFECDPVLTKPTEGQHCFVRALLFMQHSLAAQSHPQDPASVEQRARKIYELLCERMLNTTLMHDVLLECTKQWIQLMQDNVRLKMAANPHLLLSLVQPGSLLHGQLHTLLAENSQRLAQVSLWNNLSPSQKNLHLRLNDFRRSTHSVSLIRYQCVLYNGDSIRGLHPVDDVALFERPLNHQQRVELVESLRSASIKVKVL